MSEKVRVRFAPSPTGALHIGGVRTALYNYLFAKKNQGDFLLRIEDTDQTRYVAEAEDYIIESLKWCGINPNEGQGFGNGACAPYRQSERSDLYKKYAQQLIDNGFAYYAFDSSEELDAKRAEAEAQKQVFRYDSSSRMQMKNSLSMSESEVQEALKGDYVVRFKIPESGSVSFNDIVRDSVTYNCSELDDKIILKSDGLPTYHLANVVDDHLMEITHVIRGEEWLPSTPLHVLLYEALQWKDEMPKFAHLPLILNPSGGGKLSKRAGDKFGFPVFPLNWTDTKENKTSTGYREHGFSPEALVNILALLGWHDDSDKEIFSLEELVNSFSLERIVKSGARFDFDKAKWINQQHLIQTSNELLANRLSELNDPLIQEADNTYLSKICGLFKERVEFLNDIPSEAYYMFKDVNSYDEKMVRKKWKPESEAMLTKLVENLNSLASFDANTVENEIKSFMEAENLGFGQILPLLRLSLSGTVKGPSVFEIMELLGKSIVIDRINASINSFNELLV